MLHLSVVCQLCGLPRLFIWCFLWSGHSLLFVLPLPYISLIIPFFPPAWCAHSDPHRKRQFPNVSENDMQPNWAGCLRISCCEICTALFYLILFDLSSDLSSLSIEWLAQEDSAFHGSKSQLLGCVSSRYFGNKRSMLIPNCLFRVGGAAVLLSNRRRDFWRSRYELKHVVRTHLGANDAAYSCVYQMEDEDKHLGVLLSKELMAIAGEALKVMRPSIYISCQGAVLSFYFRRIFNSF